jgi:hypothetical protein
MRYKRGKNQKKGMTTASLPDIGPSVRGYIQAGQVEGNAWWVPKASAGAARATQRKTGDSPTRP